MLYQRRVTLSAVCASNPFDQQPSPEGPPNRGGPVASVVPKTDAQRWRNCAVSSEQRRRSLMKLTILTLATATLVAASPAAFAQGVSSQTPGHRMQSETQTLPTPPVPRTTHLDKKCSATARRAKIHQVPARPAMLRDVRLPARAPNISCAGQTAASLRGGRCALEYPTNGGCPCRIFDFYPGS
jgi:hypothetical protein